MTKIWVRSKDVQTRYGGAAEMTLWRWSQDPKLGFPFPVYINHRRYWDEAELDAFDNKLAEASLRVNDRGDQPRESEDDLEWSTASG